MLKILNYIFWPSLAGLLFALSYLYFPVLLERLPVLQGLLPQPEQAVTIIQNGRLSYSQPIKKAAPAVVSINYKETVGQQVIRVIVRHRVQRTGLSA